ncbi:tRNA A37 threonylcarbamoyladenosine dehydratase [Peptoniphilus sp. ING2-D1G]|nr:tRNA A37 threonylcarbamoyladenosine dehydratase [Peptoniphilus sp. ING2-D1G]
MDRFDRTIKLIGEDNLLKIKRAKIIVFGLGGVGGSLCEALVRSGIKKIALVDDDVVDITNLNRQLVATESCIGEDKVDAMEKRLKDINSDVEVKKFCKRVTEENVDEFNLNEYDFIADAIDTVSAKVALAQICYNNSYNLISAMGAGNRVDPTQFRIDDIFNTCYDPLSKAMRKELKKRGVEKLKVVYSTEKPLKISSRTPGSMSFVPPVCGMVMASYIIRSLIEI